MRKKVPVNWKILTKKIKPVRLLDVRGLFLYLPLWHLQVFFQLVRID